MINTSDIFIMKLTKLNLIYHFLPTLGAGLPILFPLGSFETEFLGLGLIFSLFGYSYFITDIGFIYFFFYSTILGAANKFLSIQGWSASYYIVILFLGLTWRHNFNT